ncbi:MAG: hypothetical protein JRI23_09940 [Deltaproteobacteria bacterium]|jgi:hypothetical protein|nr:hypothetical protein [Deltaproteobacteria bacterium]MBW2531989.1 hypothetical protein [Deltaproteobacteria bacterium]
MAGVRSPQSDRRLITLSALIAAVASLWQIGLLLRLFGRRFRYPAPLDWLESSALYQAVRMMNGQTVFGPPETGYLPLFHPPGYTWLLGRLGPLVGIDYASARAVSLACFAVASILVVRTFVRAAPRSPERWALGLAAIGIAAAGAPLCASYYDLIRSDTLTVLLCVVGATLCDVPDGDPPVGTRDDELAPLSWARVVGIAAIGVAIVYTRVPAVWFVAWLVIYVTLRWRRRGLVLGGALIGACAVTLLALQLSSDGWYFTYTVAVYAGHPIRPERVWLGLRSWLEFAPFVVALPIVVALLVRRRALRWPSLLWCGMLLCALPAGLLPYIKRGGSGNDLVPMAFLLGPATMWLIADLGRAWPPVDRSQARLRAALLVATAAFLLLRTDGMERFVPTDEARAKTAGLNALVRDLPGTVIAPHLPFLPVHNGHDNEQFSTMPYTDAEWGGLTGLDLGSYLDRIDARWALISGTEPPLVARELAARYQLERRIDGPKAIVGYQLRLGHLLRRLDTPRYPRVLFDFETAELVEWHAEGDLRPHTTTVPPAEAAAGILGERHLSTRQEPLGIAATGRLVSPGFVVDRRWLAFRIGGGRLSDTGVALLVDGERTRVAHGIFRRRETSIQVVWNVADLNGREVRIELFDDSVAPTGYVSCDRVMLYER